jgi:transcriptional regulator with XRE-family HTH domain
MQEVVDIVSDAIKNNILSKHCSLTRGYLSNLEAGKYTEPSVFKLEALAYVYNVPYESLLQKAGYLKRPCDKGRLDTEFTLMVEEIQKLTSDDKQSVREYIDFLKSKRTKRCSKCQK